MTLSQIECFLLVVDKMSFTEAAKLLYVSQPAISRRISLLEEEIGIELFTRINSRLALTDAGEKFAVLFRNFVNDYNRTVNEIRRETPEVSGTVRIGCADGWDVSPFLNMAKSQLMTVYPKIDLSLQFLDHEKLLRKLSRREIDLAIDQPELFARLSGITVTPIRKVSCILMFSRKHPLAEEEDLTLSSFRSHVFYMRASDDIQDLSGSVLRACLSCGFRPEIEYVDSQSAAYAKMLNEDGVFFADEYLIEAQNPLFSHIRLPFERTIALAGLKDKSPAGSVVETTIIKCCEDVFGNV